jgi:hypothetical protein
MPGVDLMRVGPDGLRRPEFEDRYMRMAPQFEVGADRYAWCARVCSSGVAG